MAHCGWHVPTLGPAFPSIQMWPLTGIVRTWCQDTPMITNFLFSLHLSPPLPTFLLRETKPFILLLLSKSQWPKSPVPCHPSSQSHTHTFPHLRAILAVGRQNISWKFNDKYLHMLLRSTTPIVQHCFQKLHNPERSRWRDHLLAWKCQGGTAPFLNIRQEKMAGNPGGEDDSW